MRCLPQVARLKAVAASYLDFGFHAGRNVETAMVW